MTEEERARLLGLCEYALDAPYIFQDRAVELARALKFLLENNGWQPIETAPRDESIKLELGVVRGKMLDEIHIGGWRDADPDHDEPSCWWSDQSDDEITPQVWRHHRPLPAPPKGEK